MNDKYTCKKCGYYGDQIVHWADMNHMCSAYAVPYEPKTDPVVNAVCSDLQSRSSVGIKKYGTTLYDNLGDLRYWLQHAYEETLDKANYLKRAIMELDKTADDNK